jgi:hypothetical protein
MPYSCHNNNYNELEDFFYLVPILIIHFNYTRKKKYNTFYSFYCSVAIYLVGIKIRIGMHLINYTY